LKRFVNIFRLIKSSVSEASDAAFDSRTLDAETDLKLAMFFLAIATNAPDVSRHFFESLHDAMLQLPRGSMLAKSDWEKLLTHKNVGNHPNWHQIKMFLGRDIAEPIRSATIERLAWWASRISRFSFYSEPSFLRWTDSQTYHRPA